MGLEKHYAGDEAFDGLASAFAERWLDCSFQKQLLEIVGDDQNLAVVIFGHLGDDAISWLKRPVPALNNVTPMSCLSNLTQKRRLKECLLRMP